MARKTETSYEVKKRWKDKTYKSYQLNLRYDIDEKLIDYIENSNEGVTAIVRKALNLLLKNEK